jgi:hypothetical protein
MTDPSRGKSSAAPSENGSGDQEAKSRKYEMGVFLFVGSTRHTFSIARTSIVILERVRNFFVLLRLLRSFPILHQSLSQGYPQTADGMRP